jgi:hypothetical protein
VTAAVRLETLSLLYTCSRWVRTVPSDMPRWRAIWALVCPAASRRSRSQCRAVSWGPGGGAFRVSLVQMRVFAFRCAGTDGQVMESGPQTRAPSAAGQRTSQHSIIQNMCGTILAMSSPGRRTQPARQDKIASWGQWPPEP